LCLLEKDPEPWFPDATLGRYKRRIAIERAKAICKACPSRAASCRWPWTPTSHHGIWGGEDIKAHLANFVDTAGDSLLFTPARGGCHVNDRVFAKDVFKSALTAISRDDMRVHDLRHFAGTMTAQVGNLVEIVPLMAASRLPGPSTRHRRT
jgi:transcription factor WhiB